MYGMQIGPTAEKSFSYVALNPNTNVNLNQNEYMTMVLGPRYCKLVEDLGGKRSSLEGKEQGAC